MDKARVIAGPFTFDARFETGAASKTCAAMRRLLPCEQKIVHVRWSGEALGRMVLYEGARSVRIDAA